jgi:hypothetical protein
VVLGAGQAGLIRGFLAGLGRLGSIEGRRTGSATQVIRSPWTMTAVPDTFDVNWIGMVRTAKAMSTDDRLEGDSLISMFAARQNRIGVALPVLRPLSPSSLVLRPLSCSRQQDCHRR